MFQSVVGSVKENHDSGSNSGRLLRDIEEISKALYLNRVSSNRSKSSGRYTKIKFANEEQFDEEKKHSSLWKNWKPFKALTHIRSHRFYCHFFLHVHTIEDIPSSLNNAYLCINWIRKEKELQTRPAPVSQGFAEFEETLVFRCPVYGSKNRHHHSTKYEAKPFLLNVSVIGNPSLETGKHWVDLTRLLPPTMDGLEVEKNLGKWTTSFKLTGKAKGAVLNVSFGFAVMGKHPYEQSASMNIFRLLQENSSTLNVQLPKNQGTELAQSITSLYEKLDEGNPEQESCIDESYLDNSGSEFFSGEFTVIDCGIEFSRVKSLRSEDRNESFDGYSVKTINLKDNFNIDDSAALTEVTEIKRDDFVVDSSLDADDSLRQQNPIIEIEIESESSKMERSRSLDDVTESDFLKLLGIDQNTMESGYETEPHSPKERLILFDVDQIEEQLDFEEHKDDNTSLITRRNAKMLEVMETKALMMEWNLDEKFFLGSPSISSGGFGSPIYIPSINVPLEFPPIAEGLDSFLETKDGGFLRSMNPCLFKEAKNGGRLIMQVSVPVVLPVVIGSSIMEILEHWTSVGNQKMQMQMNKLMPLEDLTGKKMEEIAWKLASKQESIKRLSSLKVDQQEEDEENGSSFDYVLDELILNSQFSNDMDSDLIALKDVAPLTMDKIEALTIQGLRIQSGLSDEEAPSTIRPQSIGNNAAFLNKGHLLCFDDDDDEEDSNKAQLNEEHNDIDHLLNLSITLDEWLRLDSGLFDELIDTSEIFAAHSAENVGLVDEILTKSGKSESCGFLGNNLTVAMRVQLRNPLRDYETVGTPMVAFIEVERVYVDLKPGILSFGEQSESDQEINHHEFGVGIGTPLFKIREVHVAGFKTPMEKNETCFWDRRRRGEQQSGSRWLIAAGMGKKKVFGSKSNAIVKSSLSGMTNGGSVDSLWSISAHVHGLRARWKELATLNHHMRNPDVVFMC